MTSITGLFQSFEGISVKRAKVYEFYKLGSLQRIKDIDDELLEGKTSLESDTTWSDVFLSYMLIKQFIANEENAVLPGAVEAAKDLEKESLTLFRKLHNDKKVGIGDVSSLKGSLSKFENLLEYDLKRFPTFSVEKTGIFDSDDLVLHAENHLSATALIMADSQVKGDFQAAGRCLAFDLFTACGFHAVRALEAMARTYHKLLTGKDAQEDGTPLGGLANDLREVADGKRGAPPLPKDAPMRLIVSNLDRMNNIYRKPLAHPEMTLKTRDEAKNVFDLVAVSIALISEQLLAAP
jgi:hypothetical protein